MSIFHTKYRRSWSIGPLSFRFTNTEHMHYQFSVRAPKLGVPLVNLTIWKRSQR